MRRPVFIAMIFLLLLRGWVGDAMATGMAAGHLQQRSTATQFVAAHAHSARAGGNFDHAMGSTGDALVTAAPIPADCAGHTPGSPADPLSPDDAAHCESCAACQACHTVALSSLTTSTASLAIPPLLLRSPAARFASATAALGQKPPIS